MTYDDYFNYGHYANSPQPYNADISLNTTLSQASINSFIAALEDDRDLTFFKDVIRNQLLPLSDQLTADSNGTYVLVEPDPSMCYDDDYITNYIQTNLDHVHHW